MGGGSGFGAESFRSRLQSVGRAAEAAELSRVTRALTELSQRIEAAEHRSTLAISGIDQQVMGVLSRIEDGERDAGATAARFDGALDEVRAAQEKIAARLAKTDAEDAPRVEAMKSLETALARMAAQIYEGESRGRAQATEAREGLSMLSERVKRAEAAAAQAAGAADAKAFEAALARLTDRLDAAEAKTSAAVAALETSFASLDARTKGGIEDVDARFSRLAAELQAKVEGDRAGLADGLRAAAADPKLDRMEGALRDLAGQVGEAEKRSAAAIDRMGHEIIRIASNMHGRMEKVEASGSEMRRPCGRRDGQVRRRDGEPRPPRGRHAGRGAGALGGEIAKIAEKLTERIGASETRTAKAMTDLGEQLEGSADRLNARYDHALADVVRAPAPQRGEDARWLERVRPPSAAGRAGRSRSSRSSLRRRTADPAEELDPFAHIGAGPPAPSREAEPPAYDPFATLEAELAAGPKRRRARSLPRRSAGRRSVRGPAGDVRGARPSAIRASLAEPRAPRPHGVRSLRAAALRGPRASEAAARDEAMFAALELRSRRRAPPPPAGPAVAADPFSDDPRRSSTRDLIAQARAAAREASEARNRRGRGGEPAHARRARRTRRRRGARAAAAPGRLQARGWASACRCRAAASVTPARCARSPTPPGVAVTITMAAVGRRQHREPCGGGVGRRSGDAPSRAAARAGADPAAAPAAGAGLDAGDGGLGRKAPAPTPHLEASPSRRRPSRPTPTSPRRPRRPRWTKRA